MYEDSGLKEKDSFKLSILIILLSGISSLLAISIFHQSALAIINTYANITSDSADGFTVSTDKSFYGLGDIIEVIGTVNNPLNRNNITIDAYDIKGFPIVSFLEAGEVNDIKIEPDINNGSFTYRFDVGEAEGEYELVASYEGNSTEVKLNVQNMTEVAALTSDLITLKPSKSLPYTPLDTVELVGRVTNPTEGKNVRIDLYGPAGTALLPTSPGYLREIAEVNPDEYNGSFSFRYPLHNSPEGEYSAVATNEGNSTITKFTVQKR